MQVEDIPGIANWAATLPLMQRYQMTAPKLFARLYAGISKGHLVLVAQFASELPNVISGFAWCIRDGAFGRSAYLRLIAVNPTATGKGIGSALLNALENHVRTHCADLFLLVSDFNTDAQCFYQRHGYEQVGALAGYVLPDVVEFIYRKHLTQA
jgi:GNAT superfamily N-acetyltransferase